MNSYEQERQRLTDRIYSINDRDFETVAKDVWQFQYQYNSLYHSYCDLIGYSPQENHMISDVPFLPIVMFRDHVIKTGQWTSQVIFRSSGTTSSVQSQHHIRDTEWYHMTANTCFNSAFGKPEDFAWLGLLPSYLERPDSSLVDMVHYFMQLNTGEENTFYPIVNEHITEDLEQLNSKNQKTILFGVSFALLKLFENYKVPVWENLLVIDTGGMKGRGQEITREELYEKIKSSHPTVQLASEYGMTELNSQAYLWGNHFIPGPTMKVFTRDISDPFKILDYGQRGVINIIDLGNIDTCAFIATDDIGIVYEDGSFDVLGRLDQSDLRGCNLLYV